MKEEEEKQAFHKGIMEELLVSPFSSFSLDARINFSEIVSLTFKNFAVNQAFHFLISVK